MHELARADLLTMRAIDSSVLEERLFFQIVNNPERYLMCIMYDNYFNNGFNWDNALWRIGWATQVGLNGILNLGLEDIDKNPHYFYEMVLLDALATNTYADGNSNATDESRELLSIVEFLLEYLKNDHAISDLNTEDIKILEDGIKDINSAFKNSDFFDVIKRNWSEAVATLGKSAGEAVIKTFNDMKELNHMQTLDAGLVIDILSLFKDAASNVHDATTMMKNYSSLLANRDDLSQLLNTAIGNATNANMKTALESIAQGLQFENNDYQEVAQKIATDRTSDSGLVTMAEIILGNTWLEPILSIRELGGFINSLVTNTDNKVAQVHIIAVIAELEWLITESIKSEIGNYLNCPTYENAKRLNYCCDLLYNITLYDIEATRALGEVFFQYFIESFGETIFGTDDDDDDHRFNNILDDIIEELDKSYATINDEKLINSFAEYRYDQYLDILNIKTAATVTKTIYRMLDNYELSRGRLFYEYEGTIYLQDENSTSAIASVEFSEDYIVFEKHLFFSGLVNWEDVEIEFCIYRLNLDSGEIIKIFDPGEFWLTDDYVIIDDLLYVSAGEMIGDLEGMTSAEIDEMSKQSNGIYRMHIDGSGLEKIIDGVVRLDLPDRELLAMLD